eukprot:TRINITY_DN877_c0_g1_i1.p1 TRINITY_DN877_c0_g1~~TRINITY_DN877_c0_g1_i1.p1  ORF type:complete len:162 (-),score=25.33 TRINITY_DN877_c0_g1_i1:87-572(-)
MCIRDSINAEYGVVLSQTAQMAQDNAFQIDKTNLYERLGQETIFKLSTVFYTKVYQDKEESFRGLFKSPIENAIRDQAEFFVQRLGGPPLYSSRKGHPALRGRHVKFAITKQAADRWLNYMKEAMDEVITSEDVKSMLFPFFVHVAYFLQNIDENGNRIYG